MANFRFRSPSPLEQQTLDRIHIQLISLSGILLRERFSKLIKQHRYLKTYVLVSEQLRYMVGIDRKWVVFLCWSAAANHLKDREQWSGWNISQRRRPRPAKKAQSTR